MPTTLITGANRGIGLALTREFLSRGHDVIATARDPESATDLNATGAEVHALDVTSDASVGALAKAVGDRPVDFLVNNAGIGDRADVAAVDLDRFATLLEVNTIAPIRVIQALSGAVARSDRKTIASLSSQLGSIANTDNGMGLAYRTSKAGLNMALKAAAASLADQGITLLTLHPGWVQTDMGGSQAPVTPPQSAAGLFKVITESGPSRELRFFDFEGKQLPW